VAVSAKVNALRLAPGDKVVIAPGKHDGTLMPVGAGTAQEPIVIEFLPGIHEFSAQTAYRRPWFISNSNDDPRKPKPIGILIEDVRHLRLQGGGAEGAGKTLILYDGRMMEWVNHRSEDIAYRGLAFDLKHPSISEFRVLETAENSAVIQVAEGSGYAIKDGKFAWTNDFGIGFRLVQQAIRPTALAGATNSGEARLGILRHGQSGGLAGRKIRLSYEQGCMGMIAGRQFQFRNIGRDMSSGLNDRSRDIVFEDCAVHMMPTWGSSASSPKTSPTARCAWPRRLTPSAPAPPGRIASISPVAAVRSPWRTAISPARRTIRSMSTAPTCASSEKLGEKPVAPAFHAAADLRFRRLCARRRGCGHQSREP